jgi:hypothetical protein
MTRRQPAWVRRRDVSDQETAVLAAPPGSHASGPTFYGKPPVWIVAALAVALPVAAFALLLAGQTVAAAALALVAFVVAIMFGPEIREALRLAAYAAWHWGRAAARVVTLRVERRRSERRLDGALRDLGSATYEGDGERTRDAQARAHDAAAAFAHACDEETRLLEQTRTRVAAAAIRPGR